jgi:hypothetical protein
MTNGGYWQVFGLKKQARVGCHPSYRRAPLRMLGIFAHSSPWREGALGANPSFRRAFAARSLLPTQLKGAGGTPRPAIRPTLRRDLNNLFDRPRDLGPPSHETRASDASFCPALRVI